MCIPDAGEASAADLREQELSAFYSEDPDRRFCLARQSFFTDMWKRVLNTQC